MQNEHNNMTENEQRARTTLTICAMSGSHIIGLMNRRMKNFCGVTYSLDFKSDF